VQGFNSVKIQGGEGRQFFRMAGRQFGQLFHPGFGAPQLPQAENRIIFSGGNCFFVHIVKIYNNL
jgi:hypothetical protein